MSVKMGVCLQDLLRSFTCTNATADVLWSYDYEKEGVVEVVEGITLVGPRLSCGALWDLSVLALALRNITFFKLLFLNVNFGPIPKIVYQIL